MHSIERRLREMLAGPLPGLDAQLRMAPAPRVGWDPHRVPPGLRDGAALLLLYPAESGRAEDLRIPLTVRGAALRHHTGQVSLPGGGVDEDESFETAALREASEEVGLAPASVRIVGRLTPLQIPISGFLLHPIVGVTEERPVFRPAEWEVAGILEAHVNRLMVRDAIRRERRVRVHDGASIELDVPYFDVDGQHVWGATAMVIAEFLAVIGAAAGSHPAGADRTRPDPVGSDRAGSDPAGSDPAGSGPAGSGPAGSGPVGSATPYS